VGRDSNFLFKFAWLLVLIDFGFKLITFSFLGMGSWDITSSRTMNKLVPSSYRLEDLGKLGDCFSLAATACSMGVARPLLVVERELSLLLSDSRVYLLGV